MLKDFHLSFQAKVIIPVVALLVFFLAIIVWLVNGRITDQFEGETRQTLRTAEAVFRNSFEIRTRNLILRYQSVANEPRFKAVALLSDPKTMIVQLNELLHEIGQEAKAMIFTIENNVMLAGARRDANLNLREFHTGSSFAISQASQGKPAADNIVVNGSLFTAISVPVIVNDALSGVLTIGELIGPTAAQELKLLTRAEIVFLASHQVALSTVKNPDSFPELVRIYNRQSGQTNRKIEGVSAGEEHFLCLAGNFPVSSGRIGYLLLSSYENALQRKQETQRTLMLISLAGILFSSLLIWVLIRKITRPLRELRDSAEAVGRGDFSRRVEVASRDECGELAAVFNQMTENLKTSQSEVQQAMQSLKDTQAQLIQTEKLSAMGKFVAGIAHELNNPLTGVIGFSQMLQESGISEKQENLLIRIVGSAERCRKIVQSLLSFSRRYRPERKPVDVNELLESALEILNHELTTSNLQVLSNLSRDLPEIMMDPHQIRQVFLNIISNTIQATEENQDGGKLQISTQLMKDQVRIRFQDNGVGISPEDLPNIFNPFFTTKPVGSGTGLGLSLAYGIVREHGGSITAESEPGQGATFTIELPAVQIGKQTEDFPAPEPQELSQTLPSAQKKILVIDDEESILELIREALATRGFKVDTAGDGDSALELAGNNFYDLVVCDWKIPGKGGQKIYEQLRQIKPQAVERFLFITGDVLSQNAEQFLRNEAKICLLKPFSVDEFRSTIEKMLTN
ncbi:ATP-binding protein [bacterium]|nr:ATP-binding protein [bacterium]